MPQPTKLIWRHCYCARCYTGSMGMEPAIEKQVVCPSCGEPWTRIERFDANRLCSEAYVALEQARVDEEG